MFRLETIVISRNYCRHLIWPVTLRTIRMHRYWLPKVYVVDCHFLPWTSIRTRIFWCKFKMVKLYIIIYRLVNWLLLRQPTPTWREWHWSSEERAQPLFSRNPTVSVSLEIYELSRQLGFVGIEKRTQKFGTVTCKTCKRQHLATDFLWTNFLATLPLRCRIMPVQTSYV